MQQLQQHKIEESAFAPSFNCYSSDSTTSTAITKVIREEEEEEEEASRFHHYEDVEGDDFEFSLSDEEASVKQMDSRGSTAFPVFNHYLLANGEADRGIKPTDDAIDASSSAITGSLQKLFIGESEESSSYSSSDADETETPRSGSYCIWRSKADGGSSPVIITKCKKSRSTGSGSKRWILFRYLIRRSNSQGNEPAVKKAESPKHKRNSGENSKFDGRWKAKTPVHEQFYGRKREEEKRKTYLPYRKDILVGLFANVNGMGKMR